MTFLKTLKYVYVPCIHIDTIWIKRKEQTSGKLTIVEAQQFLVMMKTTFFSPSFSIAMMVVMLITGMLSLMVPITLQGRSYDFSLF